MAHIPTIVLIHKSVQNAEHEVEQLLAPYYQGLYMKPYIVRPSPQQIQEMFEHYETDKLEEIVEYLDRWIHCYESGIDEQGLYGISTSNPQTKWDSWNLDRNWFSKQSENIITVAEFLSLLDKNRDGFPFAVVKPDGTWHGQEDVKLTNTYEKFLQIWLQKITSIVNKHSDCLVVFCDLHI